MNLRSILLSTIISLAALCSCLIAHRPTNKRTLMQGRFTIQNNNQKVPEIRIVYNGMETKSNKEGLFAFPLTSDDRSTSYRIVFCKNIDQKFEVANTLNNIILPAGERSRILTLNCRDNEDGSFTCISDSCKPDEESGISCTTKTLQKDTSINTKDTIFCLVDPDYVEGIKEWKVAMADNFIKLPQIVLNNAKLDELKTASAHSLLSSLDYHPFHEPVKGLKRKGHNVKVAVIP